MTRPPVGYRVLTDDDVRSLAPERAIEAVRAAVRAHGRGRLVAPPRFAVPGSVEGEARGKLVFTCGAEPDTARATGFRVYDTFPPGDTDEERAQIVCVFDSDTGALRGVVIGNALGPMRTGAIGAVAVDVLAPMSPLDSPNNTDGSLTLGIIGTGVQAAAQLAMLSRVRTFGRVVVWSRSALNVERFCAKHACDKAGSAKEVAAAADVLVCATSAGEPVVDIDAIRPGAHVTTLGPKTASRHEMDPAIAERASLICTDSPAQLDAYAEPFFISDPAHRARIRPLGEVLVEAEQGWFVRPPAGDRDGISLFCSVGLGGTEVVLANAVLGGPGAEELRC